MRMERNLGEHREGEKDMKVIKGKKFKIHFFTLNNNVPFLSACKNK
jgi:hypothetical protein